MRAISAIVFGLSVLGFALGAFLIAIHGQIQEDAGSCLATGRAGFPILIASVLIAGAAIFSWRRHETGHAAVALSVFVPTVAVLAGIWIAESSQTAVAC